MRHCFRTEQWVPYPVARVFAFFADPGNLPPLMPAWQRARIEEATLLAPPPTPGALTHTVAAGMGSRMTISFRPVPLLPFRLRWDAVIVDFEWNRSFCDEQRPRGPFHYWRHRHTVTPQIQAGVAGTSVADELEYELPFGLLGEAANSIAAARQIRGIFAFRQRRLPQLLSAAHRA